MATLARLEKFSLMCVCRMCAMPGSVGPNRRRLFAIPDSETPPKLTPWYARSRETNIVRPPALGLPIGKRHLHRGVDRFRARVRKEDVVQVSGRQLRNAACQLELLRMAARERRNEVEFGKLRADRLRDFLAAMPH